MEFYEKLSFLLHITNTNNNELATAIGVGPSIISLYKTGRRPMPKKSSKIRKLSHFFGCQVLNKYQRQALAEKMENNFILTQYQPCDVEEAIFCWFNDDKMATDGSTQRLVMALSNPKKEHVSTLEESIMPSRQTTKIYSGAQGKVDALRDFLAHALTLEEPKTIYMAADDNREWFYKDPTLDAHVTDTVSKLIKKGCHIEQVLPPTNNEFLLDVFSKWIPFYLTGQVTPYYYPRYRDTVFRGFQFAIENNIGLMSYGVLNGQAAGFAAIVTEPPLVNDVAETVKDLIRLCQPALNIHKDFNSAYYCFEKLQSIPVPQISLRNSLPPESLSKQDVENIRKSFPFITTSKYLDELNRYIEDLKDQVHVDIVKLANARQVRSGKVKMIVPGIPLAQCPSYTPASYIRHLRNIINLLETYDNYFFAPISYDIVLDNAIFIRQNTTALLVNNEPFITYEVNAPELVIALQESLLRKLDNIYYKENGKQQIIKQLQNIISDLKH